MPKAAINIVAWSQSVGGYALRDSTAGELAFADGAAWSSWLATQRSFAFHGQAGQMSLLQEARAGGIYWYAYRRHGPRTAKRYVGRTADLTFARLEAVAGTLNPHDADRSPAAPGAVPATALARPEPAAPEALLAPKMQMPRLQDALIDRQRLVEALGDEFARSLTLVCAPAGFGKTTLVRQWLAHVACGERTVQAAWVALDAGDNDPIRFWRYVVSACQALQGDGGATALAQLQLPPQPAFDPAPIEAALTTLLNALARSPGYGILVLDDYHVITSPRIHQTMAFFLEHLPPALHVVISTRQAPPLPLARLRARGYVSELSSADMRFTAAEAAAFLQQAGAPPLPETLLRQLDVQLEGWPAGLRLLALALRGSVHPTAIAATLATFAGGQRPILDYFVGEVLHAQPAPLQGFLLRTSVLTRLSAPLCDTIMGRGDSAEQLAVIAQANLFLEPLDDAGQWYRYHALFAEAMQVEARLRLGADTLRRLSLAASAWYEQHGMLAASIEAALRAEDVARAAALLEQLTVSPYFSLGSVHIQPASEFHTLRRWLEQIPAAEFERRPALLVSYATALLFVSLVDQVPTPPAVLAQIELLLERAEASFRVDGNTYGLGQVFAFRALIVRQRGAVDAAVGWGQRALAHLPADEVGWRSISLGAVGMGALMEGALAEAEAAFQAAHALCARIDNPWWTRANSALLSYVLLERGSLRQANAQFQQMLVAAREQADRDDIARAQLCLAQIAYEWNDLAAARQHAATARELGEYLGNEEIWAQAAFVLARVQHAEGQTAAALQQLAVVLARLQMPATPMQARLARAARAVQAQIQLSSGDLAAAERWLQSRSDDAQRLPQLASERELRIVARLQIALGAPDAALAVLAPMLATAQSAGRARCTIEILALMALVQAAHGQRAEAARQLRAVLVQAIGEGHQRIFLDQGTAMRDLLQAVYAAERDARLRGYVHSLLHGANTAQEDAAASSPAPHALAEPLSPHERHVLRLLAAGRSNPEIARELVVSVNTIRTQVQSVYRKLGVHNRVAASALARRLDLL